MAYFSENLQQLYDDYRIYDLPHGIVGDKLGDVFEDYCIYIFQRDDYLRAFNARTPINGSYEYTIFATTLLKYGIPPETNIQEICATNDVLSRVTGGLPKTDIILDLYLSDTNRLQVPISVKQSTASKVAFAEFDVDTIVREVGITDTELINLLKKHQTDASAKKFSSSEKQLLTDKLQPISKNFVKWVATGCPHNSCDLRIPKIILKFDLARDTYIINKYAIYTSDEYVEHIMYNHNGELKKGGFGTGLSWTYATGSKGHKIQFKG